MLRCLLVVAALMVAGAAAAQEVGRYQIVNVPLGIAGESGGTTVLLDTGTGRAWHIVLDDRGRPRWRGIEMAGGSQALAEAPGERPTAPAEEPSRSDEPALQEGPEPSKPAN